MFALRRPVAEVRGAGIADKGDRLTTTSQLANPAFPLARENERGTGLAIHAQAGEELLAPDAGGNVDPALVTASAGLQPAVADRRDRLPDGSRLQDDGGRDEQEGFAVPGIVSQGDVAQAVEPVQEGKGMVEVLAQFLAGPGFLEQPGGGRRGGPPSARGIS